MPNLNKQSVDTTLPKSIYTWVRSRDAMLNIMNTGDATEFKRLPDLVKNIRKSENVIKEVKKRLINNEVSESDKNYIEDKYNEFVKGLDNRQQSGTAKGNKKKLPFIKENGEQFTDQDITDAMRGGTLDTGFLSNRLQNKDSKEFKDLFVSLSISQSKTEQTRETELIENLRTNQTPEDKEKQAKEAKEEKEKEEADAKLKADAKAKEEADAKLKEDADSKAKEEAEAKLKEDADSKLKEEEEEGVTVEDAAEPEGDKRRRRGGIGGEKAGETQKLEDVAEEDGLKGDPDQKPDDKPEDEKEDIKEDVKEDVKEDQEPEQEPVQGPEQKPTELPDNRGTVTEIPDILDASRSGTPSGIVKGADNAIKQDEQRAKMNIARLKEEIRALHLIYDNNIEKFRSNPHKADKDDALKSDDIAIVRKHHKDMEISIREYYRSGGGDSLQVGVIVPIDTYLQQYLTGGKANEVSIPKVSTRTTGKEGVTSVGLGHRDGDLTSKKHDPYSRAISQGIYYQRGGMGSYKQRAVSNHNIRIGGKDKIGQIKDPKTRVDAVMNNFLNRAVKELPNPLLKLKI